MTYLMMKIMLYDHDEQHILLCVENAHVQLHLKASPELHVLTTHPKNAIFSQEHQISGNAYHQIQYEIC